MASPAKNICEKPLSIFQVKTEIESMDEEDRGVERVEDKEDKEDDYWWLGLFLASGQP